MQILVADDSATIRKVFELAFENEEIEVLLAGDGAEALEIAARQTPAMIIADVNMPGLDGFELCEELKKEEATRAIPVYLMSSALDEFDEDRFAQVKAAGRFEKPFRSEDMVGKVKAVIASIGVGGAEPEEEDTFEDVDVSLDSIMDSVDQKMTGPEERSVAPAVDIGREDDREPGSEDVLVSDELSTDFEDESLDVFGDEADALDIESALRGEEETGAALDEPVAEPGGEPDMLELNSAALVEEQEETGAGNEEDLEVEIVSVQDSAAIDEALEAEIAAGSGEILDDEVDTDLVARELAALERTASGPADDELTDESERMLQEIDEEIEKELLDDTGEDFSRGDERFDERKESERRPFPSTTRQDDRRAGPVYRADDSASEKTGVEAMVRRALDERLATGEINNAIAETVRATLEEMKPEILESVAKIVRDVTLNVAEDMIRKTIDQIKTGD